MTEAGEMPPEGWPGVALREIKKVCPSCANAERIAVEAEAWRDLFINFLHTIRDVPSVASVHTLALKALEIVVKPEGVSKVFTLPCDGCFGHGHVGSLDGESGYDCACKKCQGTGYIKVRVYMERLKNLHSFRYCPACQGQGFTGTNAEWMECHPCNGMGCVQECPLCKGVGCGKCASKGYYMVDYP